MAPSAPEGPAGKVDWVFAYTANVHVANHRDWFTSYTPFKSTIGSHMAFPNAPSSEVLGIGTVELIVRLYATSEKKLPNHRVLILHNVLHVPSYICNVLGGPIVDEYNVKIDFSQSGPSVLETLSTGERAGLFEKGSFYHLCLHGRQAGQSSLKDSGGTYIIGASWPEEERARWEEFRKKSMESNKVAESSNAGEVPRYTDEEKRWIKQHFKGEYRFLRTYGLSIYKEDQREAGRKLVRQMMMEGKTAEKAKQKRRKRKANRRRRQKT